MMNDELSPALAQRSAFGVQRLLAALRPRLDLLIAGALLLLPLLVFLPAALLRGVFYIHDVQYYFFPYHTVPATLLARGELPLWNPYTFSGLPLLGDGQTALFYPPSWLFFVLSGGAALNYDVLLQFGIAGLGMYLFARALGLWRLPALVGAVVFMFCGFLAARVVHLSILSGAALIPLVFMCVERAFRAGVRGQGSQPDSIIMSSSQVPSPKSQVPSPKSQAPSSKPQGPSPKSQARRYGWLVAAAVAVAMQALAGHPQVPVYTALALGLYALVRAVDRWRAEGDWRWLYRLPLTLAAIYLLGYGLAAIQLIPWVELGSRSPRAAGAAFEFVFGNSATGVDWLMLLFPYLFGSLQNNPYAGQPVNIATAIQIWEHAAYVGSLPLALAAYALLGLFPRSHVSRFSRWNARSTINSGADGNVPTFQRSNVPTLYFGLLLLGAVLFAAGSHTPLARLIYAAPVVGKLRDVERAMVLADFALAALAAIGMQRVLALGAQPRSWRPALLALAIVIALLPLGAVLLARQPSVQQALQLPPRAIANLQLSRLNAAVPVALGLLSAALLLWWSRRPATRLTQALAAGLVLLDVGGYAAAFNPTADPGLYQRRPDVLAALPADAAPYRKATFLPNNDLDNRAAQETLAVSWGMVYGVEDINGFNSLQPRRYTDYLVGPQVGDVSYGQLSDERLLRPESPILSSLNVRYLLVPASLHPQLGEHFRQVYQSDEVRVYENVLAYPRAYFADSVRGEVDPAAVLRAVTADGFDGRRVALVESAEPPALPPPASDQDRVEIAQRSANRIALATSAATPRLLVLSEMDFPGWRAAVDGAATPIYTTNYLFRGVVVPPGAHTVTFEYRPVSALLGAGVSAAALLASLLLIVAGRSWRKLK